MSILDMTGVVITQPTSDFELVKRSMQVALAKCKASLDVLDATVLELQKQGFHTQQGILIGVYKYHLLNGLK